MPAIATTARPRRTIAGLAGAHDAAMWLSAMPRSAWHETLLPDAIGVDEALIAQLGATEEEPADVVGAAYVEAFRAEVRLALATSYGVIALPDAPTIPHRIDAVVGGSDADPFGAPGRTRLRLSLLEWPGRDSGAWTWYRGTVREMYELVRHFSRIVNSGCASDDVGGSTARRPAA